MKNPWTNLPEETPYLLPSDYDAVMEFNRNEKNISKKIRHELWPEPYLGRIDAEVVLLNKNPGFSSDDHLLYEQGYAAKIWKKNLLHKRLDYAFFLLDPQIKNFKGPRWWEKRLGKLLKAVDRKTIANRLLCIEYFPYHSKKFGWKGELLESQKYSFYLVELAIKRGALVIIMRGARLWYEAVPLLCKHQRKYELNSPQNVVISRRNCPEGFPEIEKILGSGGSE